MNDNATELCRQKIMIEFLRNLIWIDDEILPDKSDSAGDRFRLFFYPIAQEFQKAGLLVHLHPYEAVTPEIDDTIYGANESESYASAERLAKKADVVILDWHLGKDDPANSIRLLRSLSEEAAIRYVVVLSQYAQGFREEMRKSRLLAEGAPETWQAHQLVENDGTWTNRNGTHVITMDKPKPPAAEGQNGKSTPSFSSQIMDQIFTLMSKANPSYLHWTALEIAARLRHSIPEWLQGVPSGADAAILLELSSEKTESREFIPEYLLEDLSYGAKLHTLDSLAVANCNPLHWVSPPYQIQTKVKKDATRVEKLIHLRLDPSKLKRDDIDNLSTTSPTEPQQMFLKSQVHFAEFCENISAVFTPSPGFGAVYTRSTKGDSNRPSTEDKQIKEVFVCLSQECDALRSNHLLLLAGKVGQDVAEKDGATILSFRGERYVFLAGADSVSSVKVSTHAEKGRVLEGFEKVGHLRKATSQRILSRYLNHITRSAVSLPTFVRLERGEK